MDDLVLVEEMKSISYISKDVDYLKRCEALVGVTVLVDHVHEGSRVLFQEDLHFVVHYSMREVLDVVGMRR